MSNETTSQTPPSSLGIPKFNQSQLDDILSRMKPSAKNLGFSGAKLDEANNSITQQAEVVRTSEVIDRFEHREQQEKLADIIKLLKEIRIDTKARSSSGGGSSVLGGLLGALSGLLAGIGAVASLLKGLPKILSVLKGVGLAAAAAGAAKALITRRTNAQPQPPKPATPTAPNTPDANRGAANQVKPAAPAASTAPNKPSLLNRAGKAAGRLVGRIPIIGGAIGAVDAVANADRVGLNSSNLSTKDTVALAAAGALDGIDPTQLLNLGASASNALFGTQFRDDRSLANLVGYKSAADIAARNVVSNEAQANATPTAELPKPGEAVDKLNEAANNEALIDTINELIKALGENAAKRSYEVVGGNANYAPPTQMQPQNQQMQQTNVVQTNTLMPTPRQFLGQRPPAQPLAPYLPAAVRDRDEMAGEPNINVASSTSNTQTMLNMTLPTLVPQSPEPSLQIQQAINPFVEQVVQTGNIVLNDLTKTNVSELVNAAETAIPRTAELITPNIRQTLEKASSEITSRMEEVAPELKSIVTGEGSVTGIQEAKPVAATNTPPGGASGDASFFNQIEDASAQTSMNTGSSSGADESSLSLNALSTELSAVPMMMRQTLEDVGGGIANIVAPTPSEIMSPIVNSRRSSVPGLLGIDDIPYVNDDQLLFQINSNRI